MRFAVVIALTAAVAGCASHTHVESTLSLSRSVSVRVATDGQDPFDCANSCQVYSPGTLGDCLSRCPAHEIEPGTCSTLDTEHAVCGEQIMRWQEVKEGACADAFVGAGVHVDRCVSKQVVDSGHVGVGELALRGACTVLGLALLVSVEALANCRTCIRE